MRPVICDFCGDYIKDEDVIEVETCHGVTGKGFSWEICEHCHYGMQANANGISIDLLSSDNGEES